MVKAIEVTCTACGNEEPADRCRTAGYAPGGSGPLYLCEQCEDRLEGFYPIGDRLGPLDKINLLRLLDAWIEVVLTIKESGPRIAAALAGEVGR